MTDANQRRQPVRNGVAFAEFHRLAAIETDDCVLWPYGRFATGYGELNIDNKPRRTHILALEMREGRTRPAHLQTCHAPGCPRHCMNYRHLRWDTQSSNMNDRVADGTHTRGERSWNALLTEARVREARQLAAGGELVFERLAREWGVSRRTLTKAVRRETWAWLD